MYGKNCIFPADFTILHSHVPKHYAHVDILSHHVFDKLGKYTNAYVSKCGMAGKDKGLPNCFEKQHPFTCTFRVFYIPLRA